MNRTIKDGEADKERVRWTVSPLNGQTLPLRRPQAVRNAPCRLRQCLQLRPPAKDASRPHALRVHLQTVDKRARPVQAQSAPANAGTKHLMCLGLAIDVPSPIPARTGDGVGYGAKHLVA
jgi:hypothetical protein